MLRAICRAFSSSFSYTTFFVSPKVFIGLPRSEKTAWVRTSRIFVIEPVADRPSVMKIDEASFSSGSPLASL